MDSFVPLAVVAVVALIAVIALARYTAELRDGASWRIGAIGICLLLFALTMWPIFAATLPGEPVAEAHGIGEKGSITLPDGFGGPVRVFVHGAPAGQTAAEARVGLQAGTSHADATLARHFESARVGRSGRTTVERDAFAQVASLSVPSDAHTITVQVSGSALEASGLTAKVYRDLCPIPVLVGVDLLAILVFIIMAIRGGERRIIAAGGALVGFGVAATAFIEPNAVIRPLIGALLMGGVLGALVAGFLGSLAARVMIKPAAVRAARAT